MLPSRPTAGPYRADQLVAIGAEGVVWRATGPTGPVALKVARGDAGKAAIAAEADRLGTCAHPHVVRLESAGPGWLATEFVEGWPIDRWALGRSAPDTLQVGLEVLAGLRALHDHGVVHGDLKPGNVLVDTWSHAKIVDVSGAGEAPRGTPGFTAPEVLGGDAPTEASDRYGFGALLYAALAGRAPHHAADPAAALALPRLRAPLPVGTWRVDVPDRVDRLLARLLLPDPADRPSLDAIEKVLVQAWSAQPRRPVVGMARVRARLLAVVREVRDGAARVVVLHGPAGSGRRTLAAEVARQAVLEGMEVHTRLDPEAFLGAARDGRIPVTVGRAAHPPAHDLARAVLGGSAPGLVVLHATTPSAALADAGAITLSPDALTRDDAHRIGAWLGVPDARLVDEAWRATHGHPRAVWVALEPRATRHTGDRAPFALPGQAAKVVHALKAAGGVATLERLAGVTGLTLPLLADQIDLLVATRRVGVDGDGWRIRLLDRDEA